MRATIEDLRSGWDDFLTVVRRVVAQQAERHLGVPWPRPSDIVGPPDPN